MKPLLPIILILGLAGSLGAQLEVSNITASQRPDTTLVDIGYDLEVPEGSLATISVQVSRDGGKSFANVSGASLSGAVGGRQPKGTAKRIVWNAKTAGWDTKLFPAVQVQVTAVLEGAGGGVSEGYTRGEPAPLTTIHEQKSSSSPTGDSLKIQLSDGTEVIVPEMPGAFEVEIARTSTNTASFKDFTDNMVFKPSGATRQLVLSGEGDPEGLKPQITIPGAEVGTISRDTVSILRIGDLLVNGEMVENHTMLLPALVQPDGSLTFVDPVMRDGVQAEQTAVSSHASPVVTEERVASSSSVQTRYVGSAEYVVMTFQDDLNWAMEPKLVRMQPDISATGNRRVWQRKSSDDNSFETPIVNVVLLVHGHNENEKAGFEQPTHPEPWKVLYKRLVWDLLYEVFLSGERYGHINFPVENTIFYEFVYPSFRSIFSPVSANGSEPENLGQSLGRLLDEELKFGGQLAAMNDRDMRFNFFIVAHSQGGLVARSGLRHMPQVLRDRLQRMVTWGSPHEGAALYSLLYALRIGYDLVFEGVRLPLQNIGLSAVYQNVLNGIAIDTPSTRDMRLSWAHREKLDLEKILKYNKGRIIDNAYFDHGIQLPYGSYFFSHNLARFNASEQLELGQEVREKFVFFHGATNKEPNLDKVAETWRGWISPWASRVWQFKRGSTPIEQGAYLNSKVLKDGYKPNDGAVPVFSQNPDGLWSLGIDVENVDHEEFYGAESPQRDDVEKGTMGIGRNIASRTFTSLDLSGPSRKGPQIEVSTGQAGELLTGNLVFPVYDPDNGGDGKVGNRVRMIYARDEEGMFVNSITREMNEDGSFSIKHRHPDDILPEKPVVIHVLFEDGSEIISEPVRIYGEGAVFNRRSGMRYQNIGTAIWASEDGDVLEVGPGTYNENVFFAKNITLQSTDGAAETVIVGNHYNRAAVRFYNNDSRARLAGFTIKPDEQADSQVDKGISVENSFPVIENCRIDGLRYGCEITVAAKPVLKNNLFINNRTAIQSTSASLIASNNTIENNERGLSANLHYNDDGTAMYSVALSENTFKNQSSSAISIKDAEVVAKDNVIQNNEGSGMIIDTTYEIEISGNTITRNNGGGLIVSSASGIIEENTINHNTSAANGGGASLINFSGIFNENIVEANSSQMHGGGIYIAGTERPEVTGNTIRLSNHADGRGGGVYGYARNWSRTETVQMSYFIDGKVLIRDIEVQRHTPPFDPDGNNNVSGNTHGSTVESYGPGLNNKVHDAAFNIYIE